MILMAIYKTDDTFLWEIWAYFSSFFFVKELYVTELFC